MHRINQTTSLTKKLGLSMNWKKRKRSGITKPWVSEKFK